MISTVIAAILSFVSTNIDDIFVLMLFFSQVNSNTKKLHVVIGQYLGIGTLTAMSIIGAVGVSIIPYEYAGLLGLVPICIGVKEYFDHKKDSSKIVSTGAQSAENYGMNNSEEVIYKESKIKTVIMNSINPNIIKVASVTIANGGDNIGIYIPLFTGMSLTDIFLTIIVFALFTALWCFLGIKLAVQPFIQQNIEKYKYILIPLIFIGLGVFILIESGSIALLLDKVF